MPALLEVRNLTVAYGDLMAVQGLSVALEPGAVTALLGPNGAGKTSALEAIACLLPKRAGSIRLAGREIGGVAAWRAVMAGLGLVPQSRELFASFSIEEPLRLPRARRGGAAIDDVYALFPKLAERRTQLAGTLSGGEQQMLAIARALVAEPAVLLLDEPSANLAPAIVDDLAAALRVIRARGVSMLLAEQNLAFAAALADRAIVMTAGQIAWEGPLTMAEADHIGVHFFA